MFDQKENNNKDDGIISRLMELIAPEHNKVHLITPEVKKVTIKKKNGRNLYYRTNRPFLNNNKEENQTIKLKQRLHTDNNNNINISIHSNNSQKIEDKKKIIKKEKEETNIDDDIDNEDNNNKYNNTEEPIKISGLNLNKEIGPEELLLSENSPLICPYEKGEITFSKKGLVDFFDKIWDLDGFEKKYQNEKIYLAIKSDGSPVNSEFQIVKSIIIEDKKNLGPNGEAKTMIEFMYDINIRKKWDKDLKFVEILEGSKENYVVNTWFHSPIFIISEREAIEKRFIFDYEGATYVMSTSIPMDYYPYKDGVVRVTSYFNLFKVVDKGDKIFYYGVNQVDFKMIIPEFIVNVTLPMKTNEWYQNLSEFSQQYKYDKINKTVHKIEDDDEDKKENEGSEDDENENNEN